MIEQQVLFLCSSLARLLHASHGSAMHAGENGNTGKVQFKEIPGPAYVSADVPGRGIRPRNAFTLKNGVGAVPNIGPINGATAYGARPSHRPVTVWAA